MIFYNYIYLYNLYRTIYFNTYKYFFIAQYYWLIYLKYPSVLLWSYLGYQVT